MSLKALLLIGCKCCHGSIAAVLRDCVCVCVCARCAILTKVLRSIWGEIMSPNTRAFCEGFVMKLFEEMQSLSPGPDLIDLWSCSRASCSLRHLIWTSR